MSARGVCLQREVTRHVPGGLGDRGGSHVYGPSGVYSP